MTKTQIPSELQFSNCFIGSEHQTLKSFRQTFSLLIFMSNSLSNHYDLLIISCIFHFFLLQSIPLSKFCNESFHIKSTLCTTRPSLILLKIGTIIHLYKKLAKPTFQRFGSTYCPKSGSLLLKYCWPMQV